jgi:hypothetical protein
MRVTPEELTSLCSIRVTGASADDEDWLFGETLDGTKSGGFPKVSPMLSVDTLSR